MTVYVRLSNGAEDTFAPFNGCAKCGGNEDYNDGVRTGRCYNCGHSQGTAFHVMPTAMWNPSVETGSDGSLTVKRLTMQVGFYPAGAWMSWRSD